MKQVSPSWIFNKSKEGVTYIASLSQHRSDWSPDPPPPLPPPAHLQNQRSSFHLDSEWRRAAVKTRALGCGSVNCWDNTVMWCMSGLWRACLSSQLAPSLLLLQDRQCVTHVHQRHLRLWCGFSWWCDMDVLVGLPTDIQVVVICAR